MKRQLRRCGKICDRDGRLCGSRSRHGVQDKVRTGQDVRATAEAAVVIQILHGRCFSLGARGHSGAGTRVRPWKRACAADSRRRQVQQEHDQQEPGGVFDSTTLHAPSIGQPNLTFQNISCGSSSNVARAQEHPSHETSLEHAAGNRMVSRFVVLWYSSLPLHGNFLPCCFITDGMAFKRFPNPRLRTIPCEPGRAKTRRHLKIVLDPVL